MTDKAESPGRPNVGHEAIEGTLSVPVLQFDLGEEINQQQKEDSWLHGVGRSSKTLVKYDDLRIVLISMKANTQCTNIKQPENFRSNPHRTCTTARSGTHGGFTRWASISPRSVPTA